MKKFDHISKIHAIWSLCATLQILLEQNFVLANWHRIANFLVNFAKIWSPRFPNLLGSQHNCHFYHAKLKILPKSKLHNYLYDAFTCVQSCVPDPDPFTSWIQIRPKQFEKNGIGLFRRYFPWTKPGQSWTSSNGFYNSLFKYRYEFTWEIVSPFHFVFNDAQSNFLEPIPLPFTFYQIIKGKHWTINIYYFDYDFLIFI